MGERVHWEVEKDLREHNIELEDEDEEPGVQPAVVTYVWHNRNALVFNLQQNKVIRYAGATLTLDRLGLDHRGVSCRRRRGRDLIRARRRRFCCFGRRRRRW